MRPILLVIAAIAGAVEAMGGDVADAQCSVFSRRPCVPGVCSVFSRHPCVGAPVYPYGEDLRVTIVSSAPDQPADGPTHGADVRSGADTPARDSGGEHQLGTIREMYAALRACWVPPPQDEARPGMQMSVRLSFKRSGEMIGAPRTTFVSPDAPPGARRLYHDAIVAALDRCTPLRFSAGLGGALAGRPLAIRYVDDRTIR
ncbi:MAG TPA: hypothetical protein VG291_02440 [Xanthobacteraceae bacterium]|nr:hypothetical protein [Xanthobacteraceae bacterium]